MMKEIGNKVTEDKDFGIQIAVLDRGFVYVGACSLSDGYLTIANAKNIRRWGTKKGLGELRNGPLNDTILDKCGDIICPIGSLIHLMKVDGEKWAK